MNSKHISWREIIASIIFSLQVFLWPLPCSAACEMEIDENPARGWQQLSLDNVEVKVETQNEVLKLRAFDAFDTFNWAYARFPEGKGPVRITAFIDKGIRIFLAQAVAVKRGSQVNWAVFKCHDCSNRILAGAAYFFVNGQKSCLKVTKREWEDAVYKVFGENFGEDKAVSANNPDEIYSKLFSY